MATKQNILVKDADGYRTYYRQIMWAEHDSFDCDCGWSVEPGERCVETYTDDTDDWGLNGYYCSIRCARYAVSGGVPATS